MGNAVREVGKRGTWAVKVRFSFGWRLKSGKVCLTKKKKKGRQGRVENRNEIYPLSKKMQRAKSLFPPSMWHTCWLGSLLCLSHFMRVMVNMYRNLRSCNYFIYLFRCIELVCHCVVNRDTMSDIQFVSLCHIWIPLTLYKALATSPKFLLCTLSSCRCGPTKLHLSL